MRDGVGEANYDNFALGRIADDLEVRGQCGPEIPDERLDDARRTAIDADGNEFAAWLLGQDCIICVHKSPPARDVLLVGALE